MIRLPWIESPRLTFNGVYFQHECATCGFFQVLDFGCARTEHLCSRNEQLVRIEWREAA